MASITTIEQYMTAIPIDDLDKKILQLLQQDGRISFADLGRKLDTAEATVRFRVKRLEDHKVITHFAALIDPFKVGLQVSGAILLKIDPPHLEVACKQLTGFKEVVYLFQSTGEYDIVSVIFAHDFEHLNDVVRRAKMIDGVKDARVSVTTRFLKNNQEITF